MVTKQSQEDLSREAAVHYRNLAETAQEMGVDPGELPGLRSFETDRGMLRKLWDWFKRTILNIETEEEQRKRWAREVAAKIKGASMDMGMSPNIVLTGSGSGGGSGGSSGSSSDSSSRSSGDSKGIQTKKEAKSKANTWKQELDQLRQDGTVSSDVADLADTYIESFRQAATDYVPYEDAHSLARRDMARKAEQEGLGDAELDRAMNAVTQIAGEDAQPTSEDSVVDTVMDSLFGDEEDTVDEGEDTSEDPKDLSLDVTLPGEEEGDEEQQGETEGEPEPLPPEAIEEAKQQDSEGEDDGGDEGDSGGGLLSSEDVLSDVASKAGVGDEDTGTEPEGAEDTDQEPEETLDVGPEGEIQTQAEHFADRLSEAQTEEELQEAWNDVEEAWPNEDDRPDEVFQAAQEAEQRLQQDDSDDEDVPDPEDMDFIPPEEWDIPDDVEVPSPDELASLWYNRGQSTGEAPEEEWERGQRWLDVALNAEDEDGNQPNRQLMRQILGRTEEDRTSSTTIGKPRYTGGDEAEEATPNESARFWEIITGQEAETVETSPEQAAEEPSNEEVGESIEATGEAPEPVQENAPDQPADASDVDDLEEPEIEEVDEADVQDTEPVGGEAPEPSSEPGSGMPENVTEAHQMADDLMGEGGEIQAPGGQDQTQQEMPDPEDAQPDMDEAPGAEGVEDAQPDQDMPDMEPDDGTEKMMSALAKALKERAEGVKPGQDEPQPEDVSMEPEDTVSRYREQASDTAAKALSSLAKR